MAGRAEAHPSYLEWEAKEQKRAEEKRRQAARKQHELEKKIQEEKSALSLVTQLLEHFATGNIVKLDADKAILSLSYLNIVKNLHHLYSKNVPGTNYLSSLQKSLQLIIDLSTKSSSSNAIKNIKTQIILDTDIHLLPILTHYMQDPNAPQQAHSLNIECDIKSHINSDIFSIIFKHTQSLSIKNCLISEDFVKTLVDAHHKAGSDFICSNISLTNISCDDLNTIRFLFTILPNNLNVSIEQIAGDYVISTSPYGGSILTIDGIRNEDATKLVQITTLNSKTIEISLVNNAYHNKFNLQDDRVIALAIKHSIIYQSMLEGPLQKLLEGLPKLAKLHLDNLTFKQALSKKNLLHIISNKINLQELSLSCCDLDDEDMKTLILLLQNFKGLKSLILTGNHFSKVAIENLAREIADNNLTLISLNIENSPKLLNTVLNRNNNLEKLHAKYAKLKGLLETTNADSDTNLPLLDLLKMQKNLLDDYHNVIDLKKVYFPNPVDSENIQIHYIQQINNLHGRITLIVQQMELMDQDLYSKIIEIDKALKFYKLLKEDTLINHANLAYINQLLNSEQFVEALTHLHSLEEKEPLKSKLAEHVYNNTITKLIELKQYNEAYKFVKLAEKSGIAIFESVIKDFYQKNILYLKNEISQADISTALAAIPFVLEAKEKGFEDDPLLCMLFTSILKEYCENEQFDKAEEIIFSAKQNKISNADELSNFYYKEKIIYPLRRAKEKLSHDSSSDKTTPFIHAATYCKEAIKAAEKSQNEDFKHFIYNELSPIISLLNDKLNALFSDTTIAKEAQKNVINAANDIFNLLPAGIQLGLKEIKLNLLKIELRYLLKDEKKKQKLAIWMKNINLIQDIETLDVYIKDIIKENKKVPKIISKYAKIGNAKLASVLEKFRENRLQVLLPMLTNPKGKQLEKENQSKESSSSITLVIKLTENQQEYDDKVKVLQEAYRWTAEEAENMLPEISEEILDPITKNIMDNPMLAIPKTEDPNTVTSTYDKTTLAKLTNDPVTRYPILQKLVDYRTAEKCKSYMTALREKYDELIQANVSIKANIIEPSAPPSYLNPDLQDENPSTPSAPPYYDGSEEDEFVEVCASGEKESSEIVTTDEEVNPKTNQVMASTSANATTKQTTESSKNSSLSKSAKAALTLFPAALTIKLQLSALQDDSKKSLEHDDDDKISAFTN